jgi:hypothetical protein
MNQELSQFAQTLKDLGYTVIVPKKPEYDWFHVFKDGRMAYIEGSTRHGFNISSTHMPSRECGTGFSVHRNCATLEVESVNRALTLTDERYKVERYKSPEMFINSPNEVWAEYSIL